MTRSLAVAFISVLLLTTVINSAPFFPSQQEKAPPSKKDAPAASSSMTGCVDEREGRYILTDDRELTPTANLEADGFPQEGFAKHLGHKVTVRGTSIPGTPLPTFKVRTIALVSERCAPQ